METIERLKRLRWRRWRELDALGLGQLDVDVPDPIPPPLAGLRQHPQAHERSQDGAVDEGGGTEALCEVKLHWALPEIGMQQTNGRGARRFGGDWP